MHERGENDIKAVGQCLWPDGPFSAALRVCVFFYVAILVFINHRADFRMSPAQFEIPTSSRTDSFSVISFQIT